MALVACKPVTLEVTLLLLVGFIPFTDMHPCVVIGYMTVVRVLKPFTLTFIQYRHDYI